jgi:hypothetical protein
VFSSSQAYVARCLTPRSAPIVFPVVVVLGPIFSGLTTLDIACGYFPLVDEHCETVGGVGANTHRYFDWFLETCLDGILFDEPSASSTAYSLVV